MVFALLAIAWGIACALLSWRYPRASERAVRDGFDATLRAELDASKTDAEKVAVVNERLADVERHLDRHTVTPKLAGWLAVAGVALVLVIGALTRPEPVLAVGLTGAAIGIVGAVLARRVGDRGARRARARADARVAAHVGDLYDAEIVLPTRPRRRPTRRPRR